MTFNPYGYGQGLQQTLWAKATHNKYTLYPNDNNQPTPLTTTLNNNP